MVSVGDALCLVAEQYGCRKHDQQEKEAMMSTGRIIRASDADREHAVGVLRDQFAAGRLTLEEFDERISSAYAAKTWTDLARLTSDLPVDLPLGIASATDQSPARGAPWRFMPLLPILLAWAIVASIGVLHHEGGDDFPFFPLIPLTIISSVLVARWLFLRRSPRSTSTRNVH
jgi:hypothetical protein